MKEKGTQICIDFFGCNDILLNDFTFIKNLIDSAVKKSGLTPIAKTKLHQFEPQGITGYALLSTSHIAIHTWPEYGYASIDVFACDKKEKVEAAARVLREGLKPKKVKEVVIERGFYSNKVTNSLKIE
jgi:S-adenosylmethionine decarboxylase proenzyme